MKNILRSAVSIWFIFTLSVVSCKKDFLNKKPSTGIVQPVTLDDMVGIMDNGLFFFCSPSLSIASSDEYQYKDYNTYKALPDEVGRNTYIWALDLYGSQSDMRDWSAPYEAIFYANSAIVGLEKIPLNQSNAELYKFTKGWAHFNRAYSFYALASNFCKSYDSRTASSDLGLPLKISPDIDVIMQRSTIKETYEQILQDLSIASELLEGKRLPTEKKNRPSLTAVYAFQARMYLNMREYGKAELAADNCLNLYPNLIDYNSVKLPSATPFLNTNDEVIYAGSTVGSVVGIITTVRNVYSIIDKSLLDLYEPDDLRFKTYFLSVSGGYVMNRSYNGAGTYSFSGLATDEIYLIKAECAARRGNFNESMTILNKLLTNRFPPSKFIPKQATNAKQALDIVLSERRKELVWRGSRWEDLKRLNKEGANITLTRLVNGVTYSLLPNDPKYVFPIPSGEIGLSGIAQNLR
ncbi:hypothetical protein AQ505_09790 [Pedobacter sp. PACM 27299]|uniref:RagB/SusD family nutrient uptake outer membrane protein n=1 Tax=Pedobacter sp. PACM 27299 TaxID=1727164 RepID=UPI000706AF14|nr:RagB/SusD family nutrient uptake outer membrane protein [Pedobacter sp. PACM 27299]ALL05757.1 hypothetical protein AQ505_09790 [Pedobacter sp. PACM 27299]